MSEVFTERGAIEAPGAQRRSLASGCERPALRSRIGGADAETFEGQCK
jgi:hypothetical protein